MAHAAYENGWLKNEVITAESLPDFTSIETDNGVRGDTNLDKLTSLAPAFTRPGGTLTAANSSFLTDGAAVVLLMSEEKALKLGYTPKAYIRGYSFTAQNPAEDLLLGSAFAIPKVLSKLGLTLAEMDVIEIHEAFAGQVLANLHCLESDAFAQQYLNLTSKVGTVRPRKVEPLGWLVSRRASVWRNGRKVGHHCLQPLARRKRPLRPHCRLRRRWTWSCDGIGKIRVARSTI